MKKTLSLYTVFFSLILIFLAYHGCSDIKDNLVTAPFLGIHPQGWITETSSSFHGKYIASNKWDLNLCKTCHGGDYRGGSSVKSCYKCHSQGPENCNVCHGNSSNLYPPEALNGDTSINYIGVGVHASHLGTTKYSALVNCNECHKSISSFSDSNHIGPNPDGVAEINFGTLSRTSIGGGLNPNPTWDRNTATCSNSYCHGYFKNGNLTATSKWTDPKSVVCGSCHGDPITGNPNPKPGGIYLPPHFSFYTIKTCWQCHSSMIDSSGTITDKTKHLNGIINVYP